MRLKLGQRIRNAQGRTARIGCFLQNGEGRLLAVTSGLPFMGSSEIFECESDIPIGEINTPVFAGGQSIIEALGCIVLHSDMTPYLTPSGERDLAPTGIAPINRLLGSRLRKFGRGTAMTVEAVHCVVPTRLRTSGAEAVYLDAIEVVLPEGEGIAEDEAGTLFQWRTQKRPVSW